MRGHVTLVSEQYAKLIACSSLDCPCPADCVLNSSIERAAHVDTHMQSAAADLMLGIACGKASFDTIKAAGI